MLMCVYASDILVIAFLSYKYSFYREKNVDYIFTETQKQTFINNFLFFYTRYLRKYKITYFIYSVDNITCTVLVILVLLYYIYGALFPLFFSGTLTRLDNG